ncbi:DUF421 domain-containing protein [Bacillus tianshenii]|nr:DUF421 domain-containing protein [Bacillus tianshenii]
MTVSELLIRVTIAFFVLFILTRIMGRKELSQMTFFNWVSAISIGSITAALATNANFSIRNGVITLVAWSIFTIGMGYLNLTSKPLRKVTTGQPAILIKNGKVMENELRSVRLDMDSLSAMLRQKNVFQLTDAELAVLETNGKLSVKKMTNKQSVTKGDMNLLNTPTAVPAGTAVISDGAVNMTNLEKLNLDQAWLNQQLQQAGVTALSDVFYGEVQQDGTLYVDMKNDEAELS